jgi:hypothetical protein
MQQTEIDRNAELVALARLVIYARESAASINAGPVQERLAAALQAITAELGDSSDPVLKHALRSEDEVPTYQ